MVVIVVMMLAPPAMQMVPHAIIITYHHVLLFSGRSCVFLSQVSVFEMMEMKMIKDKLPLEFFERLKGTTSS
jgi:PIN domain nuclease of toxin-antitoxin system